MQGSAWKDLVFEGTRAYRLYNEGRASPLSQLLTHIAVCTLLGLFASIALWPILFANVIPNAQEMQNHYRWVVQVAEYFRQGVWWPQWMPLSRGGLGEPVFVYYPPLFHWFCALLVYVGIPAALAMKLVLLSANGLLGAVIYFNTKGVFGCLRALAAAGLTQLSPHPVWMAHVTGTWPWYTSLPLIAMCVCRLSTIRHRRRYADLVLAVVFALLIGTHVLSALMVLCCALGVVCLSVWKQRDAVSTTVIPISVSIALGLAISASYLLPALGNLHAICQSAWATDVVQLEKCFIFPTFTFLVYGPGWPLLQWVIAGVYGSSVGLFAISQIRDKTQQPAAYLSAVLAIAVTAIFFASELSYPFWQLVSPLRRIQFPFRFLAILATVAPVCLAAVRSPQRWTRLGATGLAVASLVLTLALQLEALGFAKGRPWNLDSRLLQGRHGTPEYLPSQASGKKWQDYSFQRECLFRRIALQSSPSVPYRPQWVVTARQDSDLVLPVFFYPAWTATIDGGAAATGFDTDTGLVKLRVPSGNHRIALAWASLPLGSIGDTISVAGWLCLVGVVLFRRSFAKRLSGGWSLRARCPAIPVEGSGLPLASKFKSLVTGVLPHGGFHRMRRATGPSGQRLP